MSRYALTRAQRIVAKLRSERWCAALAGAVIHPNDKPSLERLTRLIEPIACAAFTLYALEWGPDKSIHSWDWPWLVLRGEEEIPPSAAEPWSILLLRCMEIAQFSYVPLPYEERT